MRAQSEGSEALRGDPVNCAANAMRRSYTRFGSYGRNVFPWGGHSAPRLLYRARPKETPTCKSGRASRASRASPAVNSPSASRSNGKVTLAIRPIAFQFGSPGAPGEPRAGIIRRPGD
jgi:hypothetical protein